METKCPECGADWSDATCEENFHQMLYWESEAPARLGIVHQLIVLSYYLQHPHLYSPEGLKHSIGVLIDFVVREITPQEVRVRDRDKVDSGKRTFKIKGTPESYGVYEPPVDWTMRASDVIAGGMDGYVENVQAWAQSIYDALATSGNLAE